MKQKDLQELYERMYFHEVNSRDSISSRQQIPLAAILSFVSVFAYILKGISLTWILNNIFSFNAIFFVLMLSISIVLLAICTTFFIRSFFGYTYEFLPNPVIVEDYRISLIKYYDEVEKANEEFSKYLVTNYNKSTKTNTKANDSRSLALHRSNQFIIINLLPLLIAFLMFTFTGADKNGGKVEHQVRVVNPIGLYSATATDSKIQLAEIKAVEKGMVNDKNTEQKTTTTAQKQIDTGRRNYSQSTDSPPSPKEGQIKYEQPAETSYSVRETSETINTAASSDD
ncbi:MAG: hypothetical protein ACJAS1_005026 [Oleiphilaceae bacterium]|jgi:hypothetical protein